MVGPFSYPNIPEFRLNFTQLKEVDKSQYESVRVDLYNGNGTIIGFTTLLFYARISNDEVTYAMAKRFYFSGDWSGNVSCSQYVTLDYITGLDFVLITAVDSPDMFQLTTPDGETHNESMDTCSSYSAWQDMLEEVEWAQLTLKTWVTDRFDYYTTGYKVVES